MEKQPLSHDELRLLYQVTVSDLSYFKTQQWSLTNYTLLLFAALVAAAKTLTPGLCSSERWTLIALAVGTALGALVILFKLQASISIRQARLQKIRGSFSSAFNEAWSAELKSREYLHAVSFLRVAVVLGYRCFLVDLQNLRTERRRLTQLYPRRKNFRKILYVTQNRGSRLRHHNH